MKWSQDYFVCSRLSNCHFIAHHDAERNAISSTFARFLSHIPHAIEHKLHQFLVQPECDIPNALTLLSIQIHVGVEFFPKQALA